MIETKLTDGARCWLDDPNTPQRAVVQRARNRFQAYQRLEGQFLSMGYFVTREDIRPFLAGRQAELMAEFGEDTDAEPLYYRVLPLAQY